MQSGVIARAPSSEREVSRPAEVGALVIERIAAHSRSAPGHIALIDGATRLSYGQLEDRSNKLASYLRKAGIGTDQCVALHMERSADFVIAALATMKAGAAYLPLDPTTPIDRVAFILSDAGAPLVLTHRAKLPVPPCKNCRVIDVDGAAAAEIEAQPVTPLMGVLPESLAYVVYTSGSTGRPKGVEITHANLANLIDWHIGAFSVTSSDRASHVAGLGFDATAWEIWPHLSAGATLYIADDITRRSPQALRDWIVAQKITIAFIPTVIAEQLLHSTWPSETALRTLLTGADTLHRRPTGDLPFALVNNYGPSECTVVATSGTVAPDSSANGKPSIGRPITNATILILDPALKPVPTGEPGELCIAGALVGRGYRNNPELTASQFVSYKHGEGKIERIYRTGDRAQFLENGEIAFLGRLDDQVKIRGYRIEPGEVVSCLDLHPDIETSAVVVRETPEGPMLVAYVVAAPNTKLLASSVREFLSRRLPDYMIPAQFVALASLPITPNGKLDKANLPAPGSENILPNTSTGPTDSAGSDGKNDASDLEKQIAALVASLLGQPSVQREDNFFMLGGHSMLGAQLVARIRETFAVKLTLRQLFGAPTVADLSAEIARMTAAKPAAK